jgi:hypothetical protein
MPPRSLSRATQSLPPKSTYSEWAAPNDLYKLERLQNHQTAPQNAEVDVADSGSGARKTHKGH